MGRRTASEGAILIAGAAPVSESIPSLTILQSLGRGRHSLRELWRRHTTGTFGAINEAVREGCRRPVRVPNEVDTPPQAIIMKGKLTLVGP